MSGMDAHGRPRGSEKPLYDVDIPTPTHAERARTMVEQVTTGTLCTLTEAELAEDELAGYPYGSFVTFALESNDPIFLISDVAEHTRNLRRDPRASLLVAEGGSEDPLANGRVTLIGHCRPIEERVGAARKRFLATHPNAKYYVDFDDFSFWRLVVEGVRYIGGYGRMSWVAVDDWRGAAPDPMAPYVAGILEHMNQDHPDALVAYCRAFSRAEVVTEATMTGLDRYGFELSAKTPEGPRPIRLAFDAEVTTQEQARQALIDKVLQARARLAAAADANRS